MPRQKEFDPDRALRDAMELFWEQGYEATSVQDLVDRMGINRFSMYDTFGSKHDLFIRALDRYREEMGSSILAELEHASEGLESIEQYFRTAVDHLSGPEGQKACLMVNSLAEMAAHDGEVQQCVMRNVDGLERAFEKAVIRAQSRHEISAERNPRSVAEYLTVSAIGLNVLGKAAVPRERLERSVAMVLEALA